MRVLHVRRRQRDRRVGPGGHADPDLQQGAGVGCRPRGRGWRAEVARKIVVERTAPRERRWRIVVQDQRRSGGNRPEIDDQVGTLAGAMRSNGCFGPLTIAGAGRNPPSLPIWMNAGPAAFGFGSVAATPVAPCA